MKNAKLSWEEHNHRYTAHSAYFVNQEYLIRFDNDLWVVSVEYGHSPSYKEILGKTTSLDDAKLIALVDAQEHWDELCAEYSEE